MSIRRHDHVIAYFVLGTGQALRGQRDALEIWQERRTQKKGNRLTSENTDISMTG